MSNPNQYQPQSGPAELQNLAATISTIAPGVQPVTLLSQNPGVNQGTYTAYTVQNARRRMLKVEEKIWKSKITHTAAGLLTERTLIWEFWDQYLQAAGAPVPKPGDKLTDIFGTNYYIIGMEKIALNLQLYSCVCQIATP